MARFTDRPESSTSAGTIRNPAYAHRAGEDPDTDAVNGDATVGEPFDIDIKLVPCGYGQRTG